MNWRRTAALFLMTVVVAVTVVAPVKPPIADAATAPESLHDPSWVPSQVDSGTGSAQELGVRVLMEQPGYITGVRFYKAAANTGTHYGSVWTDGGVQLGQVTFTGETASGWQEALFAAPVAVAGDTYYVISYSAPNGHYSIDDDEYATDTDDFPFHIPEDSGYFDPVILDIPSASSENGFGVDFLFERTPLGDCPCPLYPSTHTPAVADGGAEPTVELGTRFQVYEEGYITGVRFYKHANNTGTHTGKLWLGSGANLATVTFTGETASGWQEALFSTPVHVSPNTDYVVSYRAPNAHYSYTLNYFASRVEQYPFFMAPNGGRYTYSAEGTFPSTGSNASYAVTAIYEQGNEIEVTVDIPEELALTVAAHVGACNGVTQNPNAAATGTSVALGTVTLTANGIGAQDLQVATNLEDGFTLQVRANGPPTNGAGHNIAAVSGTNASPGAFPSVGTEAFGYTTSDAALGTGTANRFTNGGAKWAALTTAYGEVSYDDEPADKTVCVAYQAGMSNTTPSGGYSALAFYTAVPNY